MNCLSPFGPVLRLTAAALAITLLAFTPATTHAQTYTVLYNFTGGADGLQPQGTPILDSQGNLYGVAQAGGNLACSANANPGCGVVFELKANGTFVVLYSFAGGSDGAQPLAGVIRDSHGNLFGTTSHGGDASCAWGQGNGCGTIYEISSSGSESVLHSFNGLNEGAAPTAQLVLDAQGSLWGTTQFEGFTGNPKCFGPGCGTIFKLGPKGKLSAFQFLGPTSDGSQPTNGLFIGPGGNFFGTTRFGGTKDFGTLFKVSSAGGLYTNLHNFTGPANPGQLVVSGGAVYGIAGPHGQGSGGTIYKQDQTGFQIINDFLSQPAPQGNLLRDSAGNLYGQTGPFVGDFTGILYKIDASGNLTVLHSFANFPIDGDTATGMVSDGHGSFYGLTSGGGSTGAGTIFKITP